MTRLMRVVVVHGIGDQRVGATVAKWSGAFGQLLNSLDFTRTLWHEHRRRTPGTRHGQGERST
jgi:hypothetical protein